MIKSGISHSLMSLFLLFYISELLIGAESIMGRIAHAMQGVVSEKLLSLYIFKIVFIKTEFSDKWKTTKKSHHFKFKLAFSLVERYKKLIDAIVLQFCNTNIKHCTVFVR